MKRKIKIAAIVFISLLGAFVLFLGCLVLSVVIQGTMQEDACFEEQIARIDDLRQDYLSGDAVKVNEQDFMDFSYDDIKAVKYNRLRTLGSHNSYKKKYSKSAELACKMALPLAGHNALEFDYAHENITDQLNMGLRTFEFDLTKYSKNNKEIVSAAHAPYFDGNSWAIDFSLVLEEIAMWSDYNQGHMPITILCEIKTDFIIKPGSDALNSVDIDFLNSTISQGLGDMLYTPKAMMGNYDSIDAMRQNNGYPTLDKLINKAMCIMYPGELTNDYAALGIENAKLFTTIEGSSDSIFQVCNNPNEINTIQNLLIDNYIVRTRIDEYANVIEENYDIAIAGNAQILSSDYVPRQTPIGTGGGTYVSYLMVRQWL